MWSFVQKRQIKRQVERTLQRRPPPPYLTPRDVQADQSITSQSYASPMQPSEKRDHDGPPSHKPSKDDVILVDCGSPSDPLDPRNWPLMRRVTTLGILGLLVFTQAWAGSSEALAHDKAKAQYDVSTVAMNLSTAAYLFGIGSGSLLMGPLSETGGRNPVYLIFSFACLFFELGAALSHTFVSQIVCRYFVGLASSGAMGINGASVGDMFTPVERTAWFPIIAWVNVVRKYCFSSFKSFIGPDIAKPQSLRLSLGAGS
jgi:DHA1 family multidrug resistance protein-like MFS transporter